MPYGAQYTLSIVVSALIAGLGVIIAGQPQEFGLTTVAVKWMGVAVAMLGILAGALPNIRKPPSDERRGMD